MLEDETVYEGTVFEKIEWQEKALIGARFTDCTFKSCRMNMLKLAGCYFTDCVFENCDLSLLKVKGSFFNRVQINNCKAIGINWFETGSPFAVYFTGSNISYAGFLGKAIKKAKFINCMANETDFSECNLTQADFSGTDLANARFSNSDLTQADFKTARNYYIDLQHNKISKAKFSLPEALALLTPFDIVIE